MKAGVFVSRKERGDGQRKERGTRTQQLADRPQHGAVEMAMPELDTKCIRIKAAAARRQTGTERVCVA